ncbi:hypothetical protein C8R46DRAFT_1031341 [Mycena filopes]|nr:hypothetical protein C8R46DRAFT_1040125 [Mycena filopes]KAJ7174737.1 hypothetical protein C8R46DRAFT_1031341 [Mycena filopes]
MRQNAKVRVIQNTFDAHNYAAIPALPNLYKDGAGVNYEVSRVKRTDLALYNSGHITIQQLQARTEYKIGESSNFAQRQKDYDRCDGKYVFKWEAYYTTPERKLTERLVQDEFRLLGFQIVERCSCGVSHREWYRLGGLGGFLALESSFMTWAFVRGIQSMSSIDASRESKNQRGAIPDDIPTVGDSWI